MTKYVATVKDNASELHDYIETIDESTKIRIVPFKSATDTGFIVIS